MLWVTADVVVSITTVYLRNTFVTPAVPRIFQAVHKSGRHTDFPRPVSRWSGFQQQNSRSLIAASKPVCQNTSSRTGTDNDVVILLVDISDTCRRRPPYGSVFPVVCITSSKFKTGTRHRNDVRNWHWSRWTTFSWWRQCRQSYTCTTDFPLVNTATIIPLYETTPLHLTDLPKMKHDLPLTA